MANNEFGPEQTPQVSQLEHMRTYGQAFMGTLADRVSLGGIHSVAERVRDHAPTATLAAGVLAMGAAGVAEAAPHGETGRSGNIKVYTAEKLSDKEVKIRKSFERNTVESLKLSSNATMRAYEDDKHKYGSIDYTESKNGNKRWTWKHSSKIKLYGLQESFSDGTERYTRGYREKRKNGSFIFEKRPPMEEIRNPIMRTNVTLWFKWR